MAISAVFSLAARSCREMLTRRPPQESPHFESGLISAHFGPRMGRTGSPKTPHWACCDLFLDNWETRTRTSGVVIRKSPHRNTYFPLHFCSRKNEGMAESWRLSTNRNSEMTLQRRRISTAYDAVRHGTVPWWTRTLRYCYCDVLRLSRGDIGLIWASLQLLRNGRHYAMGDIAQWGTWQNA